MRKEIQKLQSDKERSVTTNAKEDQGGGGSPTKPTGSSEEDKQMIEKLTNELRKKEDRVSELQRQLNQKSDIIRS